MFTYVGISALGFFFVLRCRCIKNVLLKLGNVLLIKYIFKICSVSVLLFRLQKYVLLLHFFFHLIFNLLVFQYSCGIQVCEYLFLLKRFTGVDRPKQTEFFALKHLYSIFHMKDVMFCYVHVKLAKSTWQNCFPFFHRLIKYYQTQRHIQLRIWYVWLNINYSFKYFFGEF